MPPAFVSTPAEQPIHQLASPLIATCNGQVEFVSGTAFVVGRGYALTAYHVIADFLARYEGVQDPVAQLDVSFELLLFVSLDEGKRTLPMKVLRVWRSAPLDIAVLALGVPEDLPDDYRWKVPRLRLLPPKVGAHISAFGFADQLSRATSRMRILS